MSDTLQPSAAMAAPPATQFTNEAANIATGVDVSASQFDPRLLANNESGGFFDLLAASDYSLIVTREYEHFVLAIDGGRLGPVQSPFPLPHPSGCFFDPVRRELVVSSTRTPNMLIWMTPFEESSSSLEIRPDDVAPPADATLFLPRKALYLPGSLYIHDLVKIQDDIFATITGHNFLAKLSLENGFERVWWPSALDTLGPRAFNQNCLQLNSIAVNGSPDSSFYTGFSDVISGPKPWKDGYGPRSKGVMFSGATREPILRGLTCPHAAKLDENRLWVCDSGFGTVGYVENHETLDPERTRYVPVAKFPGFTRGLAFAGELAFVGLSKVIPKYEPYAPGLDPAATQCGIWAFNWRTGEQVASLTWPDGYQIYDVQIMPGIKNPRLPLASRTSDGINPLLRFLA